MPLPDWALPTRDRLVNALRRLVEELGADITWAEFRRRTNTRPALLARHFGTWGDLRVAAGLDRASTRSRSRPHYTAEDILGRLRELVAQRGPRITRGEFTRETGISETSLVRHCGGWTALRRRAGLVPRLESAPRLTDDDLLETFDRIARKLGRPPTEIEFNRLTRRCRLQALYRRFGRKSDIVRRWRQWRAERSRRRG